MANGRIGILDEAAREYCQENQRMTYAQMDVKVTERENPLKSKFQQLVKKATDIYRTITKAGVVAKNEFNENVSENKLLKPFMEDLTTKPMNGSLMGGKLRAFEKGFGIKGIEVRETKFNSEKEIIPIINKDEKDSIGLKTTAGACTVTAKKSYNSSKDSFDYSLKICTEDGTDKLFYADPLVTINSVSMSNRIKRVSEEHKLDIEIETSTVYPISEEEENEIISKNSDKLLEELIHKIDEEGIALHQAVREIIKEHRIPRVGRDNEHITKDDNDYIMYSMIADVAHEMGIMQSAGLGQNYNDFKNLDDGVRKVLKTTVGLQNPDSPNISFSMNITQDIMAIENCTYNQGNDRAELRFELIHDPEVDTYDIMVIRTDVLEAEKLHYYQQGALDAHKLLVSQQMLTNFDEFNRNSDFPLYGQLLNVSPQDIDNCIKGLLSNSVQLENGKTLRQVIEERNQMGKIDKLVDYAKALDNETDSWCKYAFCNNLNGANLAVSKGVSEGFNIAVYYNGEGEFKNIELEQIHVESAEQLREVLQQIESGEKIFDVEKISNLWKSEKIVENPDWLKNAVHQSEITFSDFIKAAGAEELKRADILKDYGQVLENINKVRAAEGRATISIEPIYENINVQQRPTSEKELFTLESGEKIFIPFEDKSETAIKTAMVGELQVSGYQFTDPEAPQRNQSMVITEENISEFSMHMMMCASQELNVTPELTNTMISVNNAIINKEVSMADIAHSLDRNIEKSKVIEQDMKKEHITAKGEKDKSVKTKEIGDD